MQRQLLQEGRYKPQDGNLQAVLRGIEPPEGLPPAEVQREGLAVPIRQSGFRIRIRPVPAHRPQNRTLNHNKDDGLPAPGTEIRHQ